MKFTIFVSGKYNMWLVIYDTPLVNIHSNDRQTTVDQMPLVTKLKYMIKTYRIREKELVNRIDLKKNCSKKGFIFNYYKKNKCKAK